MFTKGFNAMRELGGKKSARVQNLWKKKPSENRSMTASHYSNAGQPSGSIVIRVPLTPVPLTRTWVSRALLGVAAP